MKPGQRLHQPRPGALLAGNYLTSFGLDHCCEELAAVTALGHDHVPLELSALVEQMYQRALIRYGPADGELLAVALLEEQAGIGCVTARHDARPAGPLRDGSGKTRP